MVRGVEEAIQLLQKAGHQVIEEPQALNGMNSQTKMLKRSPNYPTPSMNSPFTNVKANCHVKAGFPNNTYCWEARWNIVYIWKGVAKDV